jgi:hypothetical protein
VINVTSLVILIIGLGGLGVGVIGLTLALRKQILSERGVN